MGALIHTPFMTTKEQSIIDAAIDVAVFSKTHTWPTEGSPDFFLFAQLLDVLATAINAQLPTFNRNIANGAAKTNP